MTFELMVEPSAARDIADADGHYAQFGKADAFLSAIDDVFEQLASRPLMYPAVYGEVRRALLRRFPFSNWARRGQVLVEIGASPRFDSHALPPIFGGLRDEPRVVRHAPNSVLVVRPRR